MEKGNFEEFNDDGIIIKWEFPLTRKFNQNSEKFFWLNWGNLKIESLLWGLSQEFFNIKSQIRKNPKNFLSNKKFNPKTYL